MYIFPYRGSQPGPRIACSDSHETWWKKGEAHHKKKKTGDPPAGTKWEME